MLALFPRLRALLRTLADPTPRLLAGALCAALLITGPAHRLEAAESASTLTRVRIETNQGNFTIVVDSGRAPLTAANFLSYVRSNYYTGTIFHRVISGFVVQGGGFDSRGLAKTTQASIANESGNGLSNKRSMVGLARADAPHSGNAQFYVNVTDNDELDPTPLRWGYAVFGRVVEGMEVVDKISRTPTGPVGTFTKDAPLQPVVITRAVIVDGNGTPIPQESSTAAADAPAPDKP